MKPGRIKDDLITERGEGSLYATAHGGSTGTQKRGGRAEQTESYNKKLVLGGKKRENLSETRQTEKALGAGGGVPLHPQGIFSSSPAFSR